MIVHWFRYILQGNERESVELHFEMGRDYTDMLFSIDVKYFSHQKNAPIFWPMKNCKLADPIILIFVHSKLFC